METRRETRQRASKVVVPVAPTPVLRRSARHKVEAPEKSTNALFAPSEPYSAAMDHMPLKDLFPNMARKRSRTKKVEVVEVPSPTSPKNTESEEFLRSKLRDSLAAALKKMDSAEWEHDQGQDFRSDTEKREQEDGIKSVEMAEKEPADISNAQVTPLKEKTKGDKNTNKTEFWREEANVVKEEKEETIDNEEGPSKRIKLEDSSNMGEDSGLAEKVAFDIEAELYRTFGGMNKKYKEKARSLLFNLKDRANPDLRLRVLAGEITPENLCSMNVEQLASKELSEWRMTKAEEFEQMVVLTETDAEQPRLVKKTHKGQIELGFEKEDVLTDVVTAGSQQILELGTTQQQNREDLIVNVEPDSSSADVDANKEVVEAEEEVLNFPTTTELLNLTDGISASPNHTQDVSMLETGEGFEADSQKEEKNRLPAILSLDDFVGSKKVREPKVSVKGDELELKLGLNEVKPPERLAQNDVAVTPSSTTLKDKFPRKSVPSPNRKPPDPGSMKNGILSQKKKEHKLKEKLWEGSFQLSGSQISPVAALFKSGDGVELHSWPKLIEIKGRVRLDALEKFLQELRLSRTRAAMVIACRVDREEGERGAAAVNALKEAANQYERGERVGYAEPVPGYELYLFPGGGSSLKLLSEQGYLDVDHVSMDEEGILIGFVVCRRSPVPTNTSHKSSSHYFTANRHALSAQLDSPTRPSEMQWTGNVFKASTLPSNSSKEADDNGTSLAFVNLQIGANNGAEAKGRPNIQQIGRDLVELGPLLPQTPHSSRQGKAGPEWMRKESAKDEDADDDLPPGFGSKALTRARHCALDDDDDDLPEYDFSAQNPFSMKASDMGSAPSFNVNTSYAHGSKFRPLSQGSQHAKGVYSAHSEAQLNPSGQHPSQFMRPRISHVGGPLDQARPLLLSSSQASQPLQFHPLGPRPPPAGSLPGPPPFGMFPPRPQLRGDGTFAVRMPGSVQVAAPNVLHREGNFNQPPQTRPSLVQAHDEHRTKVATPLLQSHPAPMSQALTDSGQRKGRTPGSSLWDDDDMPEWCPPPLAQQSDGLQLPPRPSVFQGAEASLVSSPWGIAPLMGGGGWQGMPLPPPPAVPPQGEGRGILQAPVNAMRYSSPASASHFPTARPEKLSPDGTTPTEPRGFKGGKEQKS